MGIVAIYIMDKQMISYVGLKSEDFVDGEAWNQIIMRHISFFWIQDDYLEFLDHIGEDNPFFDRVIDMVNEFKGPMTSVRKWSYLDANFRDLVVNIARLDPAHWLSVGEALEHPFFGSDNT
ncbi:calcium/calmodulin dependent protein kinase [Botrytis cinerea]